MQKIETGSIITADYFSVRIWQEIPGSVDSEGGDSNLDWSLGYNVTEFATQQDSPHSLIDTPAVREGCDEPLRFGCDDHDAQCNSSEKSEKKGEDYQFAKQCESTGGDASGKLADTMPYPMTESVDGIRWNQSVHEVLHQITDKCLWSQHNPMTETSAQKNDEPADALPVQETYIRHDEVPVPLVCGKKIAYFCVWRVAVCVALSMCIHICAFCEKYVWASIKLGNVYGRT